MATCDAATQESPPKNESHCLGSDLPSWGILHCIVKVKGGCHCYNAASRGILHCVVRVEGCYYYRDDAVSLNYCFDDVLWGENWSYGDYGKSKCKLRNIKKMTRK